MPLGIVQRGPLRTGWLGRRGTNAYLLEVLGSPRIVYTLRVACGAAATVVQEGLRLTNIYGGVGDVQLTI